MALLSTHVAAYSSLMLASKLLSCKCFALIMQKSAEGIILQRNIYAFYL
jgi:hypothetical protein